MLRVAPNIFQYPNQMIFGRDSMPQTSQPTRTRKISHPTKHTPHKNSHSLPEHFQSERTILNEETHQRYSITGVILSKARRFSQRLRHHMRNSVAIFHDDAYGITWAGAHDFYPLSAIPIPPDNYTRTPKDKKTRVFLISDHDTFSKDGLNSDQLTSNHRLRTRSTSAAIRHAETPKYQPIESNQEVCTKNAKSTASDITPVANSGSDPRKAVSCGLQPTSTPKQRIRKKGVTTMESSTNERISGTESDPDELKKIIQRCYLESLQLERNYVSQDEDILFESTDTIDKVCHMTKALSLS